jgi:predicted nucleic acid-binding protein
VIYYLDISALVKRYYTEKGSTYIHELFQPENLLAVSKVAYAELLAALARKRREKEIGEADFGRAVESLQDEWKELLVVEVTDAIFTDLLPLVRCHPLRGFDAIHLCSALWLRKRIKSEVLFVCSDHNLLATAEKEKLGVYDPEVREDEALT